MKYTLLELTQNILSSMGSDEITSIHDTTEASQVAEIIRTTYFNIISSANLPEHNELFQLTATDSTTPVWMTKPDDVSRIDWIKYNRKIAADDSDFFGYIYFLPTAQFLTLQENLNSTDSNVGTMTYNSETFYFKTDAHPQYYTIFDNKDIIFDSYYSTLDTTGLVASKTQCFGHVIPTFDLTDNFTPDLDDLQFPLLLNEAKSLAFIELKQSAHAKAEQEARRQWRLIEKSKRLHGLSDFDRLPHFGRK